MQEAIDGSSMLSGETSPTLDLLVPEVEVDIVTEEVVYFEDVE
jgi:hypothetical protein